jgi:4-hydroxybenzoate polyprenyltransferase
VVADPHRRIFSRWVGPKTGFISVCVLAIFSVFWLAGFDIIYATLDEEFDREAKLFSLPACWGAERALKNGGLFHLLAFIALIILYAVWFRDR